MPVPEAALELRSRSPLDTQRVGRRLAAHLRGGDVVALWGELGSGKTVLARGLAAGLGLDPAVVSSPTFVILHEHAGGRLPLFHLDLYRLDGGGLRTIGWEECLEAGGVTAIEWPERAAGLLPEDRVDVRLEHVSEEERRLVLAGSGPRAREIVEGMRTDAPGA
ncbi:MAG: tRNA (adenosine(37)-N6)-threonylcarbamoyltransferase complex ATPase subunit type 1 TsaE [Candidatus Limnocylindria bacterium]